MNYDKENYWYGWNGGECPVHRDTEVEVIYRGRSPEIGPAGHEDWTHNVYAVGVIVAFRIIRLYREPRKAREWWVNVRMDGSVSLYQTREESISALGETVHVREVLGDDDAH
jgi:hypothetical protein